MEPVTPSKPLPDVSQQPEPVAAAVLPVVKMDESTNDSKTSMSEDDLMKLRKINFKKKVSGEKI